MSPSFLKNNFGDFKIFFFLSPVWNCDSTAFRLHCFQWKVRRIHIVSLNIRSYLFCFQDFVFGFQQYHTDMSICLFLHVSPAWDFYEILKSVNVFHQICGVLGHYLLLRQPLYICWDTWHWPTGGSIHLPSTCFLPVI